MRSFAPTQFPSWDGLAQNGTFVLPLAILSHPSRATHLHWNQSCLTALGLLETEIAAAQSFVGVVSCGRTPDRR